MSFVDFIRGVFVYKLWIFAGLLVAGAIWVAIRLYRAKREHAAGGPVIGDRPGPN